jgi:hypothetical protein
MISGFDLNEKLKENLCLEFGAFEAISELFNDGVPLIPEMFLETIVKWDKDVDPKTIKKAFNFILIIKKSLIEHVADMSDPVLEFSFGHPQIIWSIFEKEQV